MILRRLLFGPAPSAGIGYSLGLLLLRVSVGSMMLLGHGWGKLTSFVERSSSFPDPLGIGSPLSMALATGAEAFCALAVILGFATRWAAVPLMVTMASGRAYHTRGRPVGEKGVRAVVLFPLCDAVSNRAGDATLSTPSSGAAHTKSYRMSGDCGSMQAPLGRDPCGRCGIWS